MKTFVLNAQSGVSQFEARSGTTYDVIAGQITVNEYDLGSALGAGFTFPEGITGGLTKTVADGYYSAIGALTKTQADGYYSPTGALTKAAADGYYAPTGALTKTQADGYYSAIGALTKAAADGYYSPTGALTQTTGDARYLQIPVSHTPSGPTDTGVAGTIAFDANFLYQCIAANSWVRFPVDATWGGT